MTLYDIMLAHLNGHLTLAEALQTAADMGVGA